MGWLLELLLDGIREICSQFIVDMMELVTEMFTELLSCNLSLFEELFSIVSALYKNVIVPMGIAMLLLILMWQLFKSMFGKSVNGEEPVELVIRSAIALFFVVAAKPIVNYILRFAGTPYQWVVGTDIKVESFSGFVSALEGVTETLGVGKLSISILMLIMQFVVAWNYFKMLFVIAERYVLLGVFSYTAPLAFSTGGSKSTNNILASWSKMFGGQVVLIILNAWCMKMFLSGYGNMMASSYGFTKFFVATLCLVGFCKITFKLDSYLASLGVNLGRPSPGMGAMGLIMAASRIISQIGRSGAGDGGGAPEGGENTSRTSEGGMQEGFTEPIPMMSGNTPDSGMGMSDSSTEGGFDEPSDISEGAGEFGASGYPEQETAGASSVLEELGVVTAEKTGGNADSGIRTDTGTGIGRTETVGTENSSALENSSEDSGSQVSSLEDGTTMDMSVSGIPEYTDGVDAANGGGTVMSSDAVNGQAVENGIGMSVRETSESAAPENGYGSSNTGIISEIGDYPVEEDFSDGIDESVMELDGSTIDSMGSGLDAEGVSYGNAGDAFGNARLASSRASGSGANFHSNADGSRMPGIALSGNPEGIISEMGTDVEGGSIGDTAGENGMELGGGSIAPYHTSETAGESRNPQGGTVRSENDETGIVGGFGLSGDADGDARGNGMELEGGSIAPYSTSEAAGESGILQESTVRSENDGTGMAGGLGLSGNADGDIGGSGVNFGNRGIAPYETAGEEAGGKIPEDGIVPGEHAADVLPGVALSADRTGRQDKASADDGMSEPGTYEGVGSYDMPGATSESQEEVGPMSEGMTMPGNGNAEEKSYMPGDERDEQTYPENADYGRKPVGEMDGQMNHMQSGNPIPAGNRKGERRRKQAREFREVPKTREELRRRQKEQKMPDGMPHK